MDLGLYVITASIPELGRDHYDVAAAAIEGGATAVQLRVKRRSMGEALKIANAIRELAHEAGVLFFVNDHVGIAMVSKADGLHTGPDDIPLAAARRMLGKEALLGRSTDGRPDDAVKAVHESASYVAVGPVYPTASKRTTVDKVGTIAVTRVKSAVRVPVVAIGGIDAEKVDECIEAGADGVAVMSAVSAAEDMVAATAELREALDAARKRHRR